MFYEFRSMFKKKEKRKRGRINWCDGMIGICELLFLENCIGTISCILIY